MWTGAEMVVWGGAVGKEVPEGRKVRVVVEPRSDGAAYDPASDRWRVLPAAPLPGRERPILLWTGERVLVFGGHRRTEAPLSDGAAYDPAADSWEALPDAPVALPDHAVWTGTEAVFVTTRGGTAYDPARRSWRLLPKSPPLEWVEDVVWTGSEAIVLGSTGRPNLAATAYDPAADRWRRLPVPDISSSSGAAAVWTSGRLFLVSPSPERTDGGEVDPFPKPLDPGGVYDPATDRWSGLPLLPRGTPGARGGALTSQGVVFWNGGPAATVYDPASGRWTSTPVPRGPDRSGGLLIWTGAELVLWGGDGCPENADCALTIPPPDALALTP
ncbi:hypothetical protein GCM10022221_47210 [Actinocorallia aurea]